MRLTCFAPQKSLQFAFDAAKVYAHTFEPFRLFYKENESLDLDAMQQQEYGDVQYINLACFFHCNTYSQHKEQFI